MVVSGKLGWKTQREQLQPKDKRNCLVFFRRMNSDLLTVECVICYLEEHVCTALYTL